MGEANSSALGFEFNGAVKAEGAPNHLTGDAGVLVIRELDDRLGLTSGLALQVADPRNPAFVIHPMVELLRSRLYAMAQGHRDQDDLDRLRDDPALRIAVSERRGTAPLGPGEPLEPDGLASQPTQSRLIETLSDLGNLRVLRRAVFEWPGKLLRAQKLLPLPAATLDVDSTPIEVHGQQQGSAKNGYYHMTCYHPLAVILHETGDFLDVKLRSGTAHTAEGVVEFMLPLIDRARKELSPKVQVRGDAGMPSESLLAPLEKRNTPYAFRLANNAVLKRMAEPYLRRPAGRPPSTPRIWTHELEYQATEGKVPWSRPRRVVLVVLEKPGEIFLDYFFLLTNWTAKEKPGAELLEFYRQRGTMEGHLGELKSVLAPALSCASRRKTHVGGEPPKSVKSTPRSDVAANEATLLLFVLSYNLLNAARRVLSATCPAESQWSLERMRTWLLRVPARITRTKRRAIFQLNEGAHDLWRRFLAAIARLAPAPS